MNRYRAFAAIAILALLALSSGGNVPNPTDLRNGWYPNMPAVTEAQVNLAIGCLVAAGAPEKPQLVAERLPAIAGRDGQIVNPEPGSPKYTPTQIVWQKFGRKESTDAVLTYLSPDVAYVDLARLGFDVPLYKLPEVRACAAAMNAPPLVAAPSPIGPPLPTKCPTCYSSAGGDIDRYKGGAVYQDGTGKYVKHEGWFAFVRGSWWEKQ